MCKFTCLPRCPPQEGFFTEPIKGMVVVAWCHRPQLPPGCLIHFSGLPWLVIEKEICQHTTGPYLLLFTCACLLLFGVTSPELYHAGMRKTQVGGLDTPPPPPGPSPITPVVGKQPPVAAAAAFAPQMLSTAANQLPQGLKLPTGTSLALPPNNPLMYLAGQMPQLQPGNMMQPGFAPWQFGFGGMAGTMPTAPAGFMPQFTPTPAFGTSLFANPAAGTGAGLDLTNVTNFLKTGVSVSAAVPAAPSTTTTTSSSKPNTTTSSSSTNFKLNPQAVAFKPQAAQTSTKTTTSSNANTGLSAERCVLSSALPSQSGCCFQHVCS